MNKPIIVVVGIIVIIAIGGFVYFSNQTSPSTDTQTPDAEQQSENIAMTESSLRDLFTSGKNIACTFEYNDENISESGTVYIAGERMRGDFTINQTDSGSYDASVIKDGDYLYGWGGPFGDDKGTKIKIVAEANDTDNDPTSDDELFNVDEKVDFDCRAWSVDNRKFAIPTDIEFTDFSVQMEQMNQMQQEVQGIDCSACDQVPAGAAQDQCRQALGC